MTRGVPCSEELLGDTCNYPWRKFERVINAVRDMGRKLEIMDITMLFLIDVVGMTRSCFNSLRALGRASWFSLADLSEWKTYRAMKKALPLLKTYLFPTEVLKISKNGQ